MLMPTEKKENCCFRSEWKDRLVWEDPITKKVGSQKEQRSENEDDKELWKTEEAILISIRKERK